MALLHYRNLGVCGPDILMRRSVWGLKSFYDFLTAAKRHMEGEAAEVRLAWRPGHTPEYGKDGEGAEGAWIRLIEPEDRPNEPEATFRAFLDENVKYVYQIESSGRFGGCRPGSRDSLFKADCRIRVIDRDPESEQLRLEVLPAEDAQLVLRPNTYPLDRQRAALRALQDAPQRAHLPLLRLFELRNRARWERPRPVSMEEADWTVLTEIDRPGTDEQRRFVSIALGTPDFAFLEGPPGSGKTTSICELILQSAKRGKRVLLCASTHVAVDNVLERLMDEANPHRGLVIPIRIGDRRNVSEKARPWQIEEFAKTERERILRGLEDAKPLTSSQDALRELMRCERFVIERMVLEAANLVCGTTIGILQHPDIKERDRARRGADSEFDLLIVDEASKTPFQEFLVPALWAKRWIVVGDPKQLSPYVDDAAMAVNIEACLPERDVRDACIDVFLAANRHNPRIATVVTPSEKSRDVYHAQSADRGVSVADADQSEQTELWAASIVIGSLDSLRRRTAELPLDTGTVRSADGDLTFLRRRAEAWLRRSRRHGQEQPDWASEIGWRLARLHEQRFVLGAVRPGGDRRKTTKQRLEEEIDSLLPVPQIVGNRDRMLRDIDRVRRVALPSVLESLRNGFEHDDRQRSGTALSDGLPDEVLAERHVLLSTQHRMHPEIAAFPHDHVYDGEALRTPDYMKNERHWNYPRYAHRAVWIDVPATGAFRDNRNKREASLLIEELRHFDGWAETDRKPGSEPWEVAVLTFYRGQEREVRNYLRRWTRQPLAMRHFHRGARERPHMRIELCTVDRFQGHEADFVLISFANRRATSFLESPNRLNVALTRARYQRVVIGDVHAMRRARGGVLKKFAEAEAWEQAIGGTIWR